MVGRQFDGFFVLFSSDFQLDDAVFFLRSQVSGIVSCVLFSLAGFFLH